MHVFKRPLNSSIVGLLEPNQDLITTIRKPLFTLYVSSAPHNQQSAAETPSKIYRSNINNQKSNQAQNHTRNFTWFGGVPTSTGRGKYFLYESEDYKVIARYLP